MPKTAKQYADEIEGIWDAAEREGRELDQGERAHMEQLLDEAQSQHRVEKGIREIGLELGGGEHVVWSDGAGVRGGSPGERFTLSKGYRAIREAGARGQSWTSGLIDCGLHTLMKGTLLEGSGAPGSGTGGGMLAVPRWCRVWWTSWGTAVGNKAVQLFIAMNGVRGSAFVEPEWVVVHPTDYQEIRLLRDTAGQFLGGGPFMGPYGNGSNLQASGQLGGAIDSLWNKQVYVSSVVGAGTALVGSRAAGQVWSRGGLSVEATNSHASYFTTDLVAIRAERRLALTLYRPAALCEVRLA